MQINNLRLDHVPGTINSCRESNCQMRWSDWQAITGSRGQHTWRWAKALIFVKAPGPCLLYSEKLNMTPDVCHTRACAVSVNSLPLSGGGYMGSVESMASSNSSYFSKALGFWNEKCRWRCILGWWGTCEKMRHAIQSAESQLTHQCTQNVLINTAAVPSMCVSSGSICWLPESKSHICCSSVPLLGCLEHSRV